jgi:glycosyltransferase involved in cell wall biosynthesis
MRWLIAEDSLESRKGHWFEYLQGFAKKLPLFGDEVEIAVSRSAEPFIEEQLGARRILPESAFSKMSDDAPRWKRYARIPLHALRTYGSLKKYFEKSQPPDVIFIPTVLIHHLLGWFFLQKLGVIPKGSRLILFFPGLPIKSRDQQPTLDGSPTSKLLRLLLHLLRKEIVQGKIILGVETKAMLDAANRIFSVPFTYFPHPVDPVSFNPSTHDSRNPLVMACYGPARSEKGSDLLVKAIEMYLTKKPETQVRFVIQWIDDFTTPSGECITLPKSLSNNSRVEIIDRFFDDHEYRRRLASTHVLLLPYRRSSYGLRVSRVVIEAMVNGIPVVTTGKTTLADQAANYGSALLTVDEDAECLERCIDSAIDRHKELMERGIAQRIVAREHFSVDSFRRILI